MPNIIYRRPMTATYYTEHGQVFCYGTDERLRAYRYSHSAYDDIGEVEVWKLRRNVELEFGEQS